MTNNSSYKGRVIILGLDGLSPRIIEPMMKDGKLPNFARLAEMGSYQRMSTTNPSQSPVAWAGFATGQNGGKNGLFDFIKRDPDTYGLSLATSEFVNGKPQPVVKAKRWWEYASDQGVPSVVLNCPVTFPAEELLGRMTSGMGAPDIIGTEGTFSFYTSDPLPETKDIGGKVFHVDNNRTMKLELVGPLRKAGKEVENVKVPFTVTIEPDDKSIAIELQGQRFKLNQGEWSDWKDVAFPMGLFKKMKGILKFYLVESSPGFKLYVSPINVDPREPAIPIAFPAGYSAEIVDNCGLYHTQGMPCDTWAVNEKRLPESAFVQHLDDIIGERKRELALELERTKYGIFFCYFETSDITQHMFWRFIDPESPLYEKDSPYSDTIAKLYQTYDGIVGEVMDKMQKEDTLIVLSDHGFDAFRRSAHVNAWLRKNGYMELKDPNAKEGADLLEDVDWWHTKAYAIGFGAVYLNLRGREKDGIVEPGPEAEALKKEIQTKMKAWMDEEKGKPVISDVYLGTDLFKGDFAKNAPDLYIGFNSGYRASWQTALGNCPAVMVEDNEKKWSGDHLIDPKIVPAILFSNKKLNPGASIYDLAPTILKMIDCPESVIKAANFDGKPLL